MPRLVIHIGPAKTATTYIQRSLFTNTTLLAEHGVYLPRTGRLEMEPLAVCHHHLAWTVANKRTKLLRPQRGGWDELIGELRGVDAGTILLSSEAFDHSLHVPGAAEVFEERVAQISDDVTLVYVARDQLSRVNSNYGQARKMLAELKPFPEHAQGVVDTGRMDLDRIFRPWIESDRVRFVAVPLSDFTDANPLAVLLRAAGITAPYKRLRAPKSTLNVTLGPIAMEANRLLGDYIRSLNPEFSNTHNAARRLYRVATVQAQRIGWCKEPFWGWEPEHAAKAAEAFAESNDRFAQAVWGTPWPMPMPLDRPQATADLLALPEEELEKVHQYVVSMATRYLQMHANATDRAAKRAERAEARAAAAAAEGEDPGLDQAEEAGESAGSALSIGCG